MKITSDQRDDYTTGCLLFHPYFNKHYEMIVIDLSRQQALDAGPKSIQQISFTGSLDQAGNITIFFVIEEAKRTILDFSQRVLWIYFTLK